MSSESEMKYSLAELRQMNRRPEPPAPITVQCPMDGQMEELLDRQEEIIRLLKTISVKLDGLATRTEQAQTRELLTAVRNMMTPPAGKKKGRRTWRWPWRLPSIRLGWGWLWSIPIAAALWAIWYAWGVISSALSTTLP